MTSNRIVTLHWLKMLIFLQNPGPMCFNAFQRRHLLFILLIPNIIIFLLRSFKFIQLKT